jgi:glycerol-3-phosphate dehydrogenase
VLGATAQDRISGDELSIAARAVVNATGASLNALLAPFGADARLLLLKAMNLVSTRPAGSAGVGGRGSSARTLFAVPWRDRTLFGTWESSALHAPEDRSVSSDELLAFLDDVNTAFPAAHLTPNDITLVHRGVVPAVLGASGTPILQGGDVVFEHAADGLKGLISVAGTKYTTARSVAERIVNRVYRLLDRPVVPSRSASTPLPHVTLTGDALLQYAADHEMVVTLADAVLRRTPLGATGCPDGDTLSRAASIVGNARGWSDDRRRGEIESVRHLY